MSTFRATLQTINVAALGIWVGSIVMTGAAAALTFPAVKALGPTLPSHATYTGEHWLIVAGTVAARFFLASDIISFACACIAIITLAALVAPRLFTSRPSTPAASPGNTLLWLRILTLSLLCAILCYHLLVFSPGLNAELKAYWTAAAAGQNDLALKHKAAFDALHPQASRLIGTLALAGLAALIAAAWPEPRNERFAS